MTTEVAEKLTNLLNSILKEVIELDSLTFLKRLGKSKDIAARISNMFDRLNDAYQVLMLDLQLVVVERTRFLELDEKASDASALGTFYDCLSACLLSTNQPTGCLVVLIGCRDGCGHGGEECCQ